MKKVKAQREYKDRLFRFIFKEKKDLLELYNAINGTDYRDESVLEITTLEDVVYIGMKNDTSFIINSMMNLYEHQSSVNPNMPLRGLFYFSKLYAAYITEHEYNQYGEQLIMLPAPRYIVFYNGVQEQQDERELRLSSSYIKKDQKKDCVEVKAIMLNINVGHNSELLKQCRKLGEYAHFIEKVREFLKNDMELAQAIDAAAEWCIRNDVLKEILMKNRAEVTELIFEEYDEERLREIDRKDAQKRGYQEGLEEGKQKGLEEGKLKGRNEGEYIKLISQVCRKLQKNYDASQIAEMLEEEKDIIEKICAAASKYTPEYGADMIYEELKKDMENI
ncbi:MAG: hypothetical protein PHE02_06945 [Lachnospiraceae bacterium]|nr:hypothetical protein [Lachnospiraceae bacterium]